MKNELIPFINDIDTLVSEFNEMYQYRLLKKQENKNDKGKKTPLNKEQRKIVFEKTDGLCHVCGCTLDIADFEADHVKPNSQGGTNVVDNFLPACSKCNNYRWNYSPEEIQWVLKLGVWLKTKIQVRSEQGLEIAKEFLEDEIKREARRRLPRNPKILSDNSFSILFPIKGKIQNRILEASFEEIEIAKKIIKNFGNKNLNSNKVELFQNKTFVLSGESNLKRSEFEKLIVSLGGQVKKTLTKNVDFLAIGNFYGLNKVYDVERINNEKNGNIRIITQGELMKYVC